MIEKNELNNLLAGLENDFLEAKKGFSIDESKELANVPSKKVGGLFRKLFSGNSVNRQIKDHLNSYVDHQPYERRPIVVGEKIDDPVFSDEYEAGMMDALKEKGRYSNDDYEHYSKPEEYQYGMTDNTVEEEFCFLDGKYNFSFFTCYNKTSGKRFNIGDLLPLGSRFVDRKSKEKGAELGLFDVTCDRPEESGGFLALLYEAAKAWQRASKKEEVDEGQLEVDAWKWALKHLTQLRKKGIDLEPDLDEDGIKKAIAKYVDKNIDVAI